MLPCNLSFIHNIKHQVQKNYCSRLLLRKCKMILKIKVSRAFDLQNLAFQRELTSDILMGSGMRIKLRRLMLQVHPLCKIDNIRWVTMDNHCEAESGLISEAEGCFIIAWVRSPLCLLVKFKHILGRGDWSNFAFLNYIKMCQIWFLLVCSNSGIL